MQRTQEINISNEIIQTKLNMTNAVNSVMETLQTNLLASMKPIFDENEKMKQKIIEKGESITRLLTNQQEQESNMLDDLREAMKYIRQLESRVYELEEKNADLEETIVQLEEDNVALTKQLEEMDEENTILHERVIELKEHIEELNEQIEESESESESEDDDEEEDEELEELKNRKRQIMTEFVKIDGSITYLKKRLEDLAYSKYFPQWEKEVAEYTEQRNEKNKQLKEINTQINNHKNGIKEEFEYNDKLDYKEEETEVDMGDFKIKLTTLSEKN